MEMTRKDFVRGAASAAAVSLAGCRTFGGGTVDETLTVFISDPHAAGTEEATHWQLERFRTIMDEIAALDPLPRRIVCFGDLAWNRGQVEDYRATRPLFENLERRGVRVYHTMGNHDRRETFLSAYPGCAKSSPVKGRIVSEIDLGTCDLLLLDTLQQGDDPGNMGPVDGRLGKDQLNWLAAELPRRMRPFFLGAHHPWNEIGRDESEAFKRLMVASPLCAGYIHGHDHKWKRGIVAADRTRMLRSLCLPASGHWGDYGYCLVRAERDSLTISLRQSDFCYPCPVARSERPANWNNRVQENRGQFVRFAF